ncbi:MAG: LemA family protein [Candidatus Pacebacteria bacterium]|nr:LemA family protein [Candidatus Paceibacterota bacterium]
MTTLWWVIIAVVGVLIIAIISLYNSLIRLKNRVDEAWSDIDVQLKRRYDLIPNLVSTVKGYAEHERETLEKVVEARNMAVNNQQNSDVQKQAEAENMLSDALKSIFALSESYPDLKANTNFLELQRELSDTENKIQAARRFYNANVRDFNTKIQVFPSNLIANKLNFKKYDYFEIETSEAKPVEVKF